MIIKKVEGDGGYEPWQNTGMASGHSHVISPGPSHTHSYRSDLESLGREIYGAELVIAFRNGEAKILRERHGNYFSESICSADEILIQELARQLFHNKLKIFQEGFMEECKKALNEIIEKHNLKERK